MWLYAGTENVFLLVDERFESVPADPAAVLGAQRREAAEPWRADGLIALSFELERPRVVFHNLDGSRPEACGNGLRCAARHVARTGGPSSFELATDAGVRRARVVGDEEVEVSMGRASVGEPRSVELAAGSLELVPVEVGNPHAVLLVDDPAAFPLAELGPEIGRHPTFPAGVNVEAVARRPDGLEARVWERGVGETRACGSGACAAAAVAVALWGHRWPVDVRMSGGRLTVRSDDSELWLVGDVRPGPRG